ncbi:ABC-type bacteriocin/lantibiotic exporter with double-glycine peptidase domain [Anoxybacillus calidus]|jgi:ABC-type bacteriocin/lantibiotic exporter with double-glycine peptidase domain|uniref:ABC-type bacteriocin/lantibiotic exporter with double-glycine peptidase domain n=1 Tax=[Anoxybacillus] calidus TaxID=575178 RepID=A0A7W0BWM5_9BACL|nr:peptidase domain-containing ABC transporter [Anoxybacillus calidus]MBA2871391.1 ABC-type bacteriocin/lantibiotic exporter with double-glycine peptidase domain [Anoxybacillus calidus]
MRKKVPYIEQMEHSECGLACLGMILGYYGFHITLPQLREEFGSSKKGTSLYDLIEMGKVFHLNGKAYKADPSLLREVSLPAIIFWEEKHYVVVEKIANNSITIVDPANGRRKVSSDEFKKSFSGYILTFNPNSNFTVRKKSRKLNFLITHILKQKKILTSIMLISLLLQGIGLIIPKFTQWITDNVILPNNKEYITTVGFGVLTLYLSHQLFSTLRVYMISRLQTLMDSSMMSDFISRLLNLHYSFFETRTSGDLIFRANSTVFIRQILSSRVISLVIDMILIIGYAAMMFYINWKLSLLVIFLCIIIITITLLSTQWIRRLSIQNLAAQTKTQSYLTEIIHGICDIKVLGAEKKVFDQWHNLFHNQLKVSQKQNFLSSSLETLSSGIQFITPLLLLWIGSYFVLQGKVTLGEVLGFTSLATSLMVPIASIGTTYSQFLLLGNYIQRLQDVVDSKTEKTDGLELENLSGKIELKNVSFKYDKFGKEIISSINLSINAGEKIAIVGQSGSGKSTLAKLILGLYSPTEGSITFDGKPIEELDLHHLRSQIGAVLQETRLFHGSILENIRLLNDQVPFEKVIEACKLADIHEEIIKQPMGYYTMISEGGSNFSGGQRQRLLLARALVNEPKILILDEATSALDNLSEIRVQQNLRRLDCTQIIIAHRLTTIVDADRIIVLKDGKIVEIGNHQELLKNKGFYYNLYTRKQKGDQNEEIAI